MVIYCVARISGVLLRVISRIPVAAAAVAWEGGGSSGNSIAAPTKTPLLYVGVARDLYAASIQDHYYNLLPTVLQLLATRCHYFPHSALYLLLILPNH